MKTVLKTLRVATLMFVLLPMAIVAVNVTTAVRGGDVTWFWTWTIIVAITITLHLAKDV